MVNLVVKVNKLVKILIAVPVVLILAWVLNRYVIIPIQWRYFYKPDFSEVASPTSTPEQYLETFKMQPTPEIYCEQDGLRYVEGAEVPSGDECQICECSSGKVFCRRNLEKCPAEN